MTAVTARAVASPASTGGAGRRRGHIAADACGQLRRHVGARARGAERGDAAAACLRAFLHRHRADPRASSGCRCCGCRRNAPTTRRMPARSCSAPSSRWRSPGAWRGSAEDFCFDQLPEDFDHFEPILEKAIHRMPMLAEAGIHTFFNGPESFTPGRPLLPRRGAGAARLLGGGGVQLDRHRVVGRGRHGAGAVDGRRRAALRPLGGRHPPGAAVPAEPALPARNG